MRDLWLYDFVNRLGLRNYRAKIMTVAFIGTHIPLIALVAYVAMKNASNWHDFLTTLGIALVATLVGTGITLFVLNHLLRPVLVTARTLRGYRLNREVGALPTHFTDEAGTLMADASHTLTDLAQALETLEYTDGATRLPNRKRLVGELGRALGSGKPLTLAVLRFTNYERLLDTLDRARAEAAAVEMVKRIAGHLPEAITLYRIGAADFAAILAAGESQEACLAAVRRWIGASTTEAIVLGELTVEPMLHGGIASAPGDAEDAETLIDHAVSAAALTSDDVGVGFHSSAARVAAVAQLQIEQDIRRALARDEFVLHYQPVVDLAARSAAGAEALIRWQHPDRGLIYPGAFIGVAETTGLIDGIGLWVLRRACQQIKEWQALGHDRQVAVNLSARQFLDPDLIRHVREAVETAGISPDRLEIELTETATMSDHDFTRKAFGKLRDLGVGIAIDDFGTGFASMSYLRKLPFNKLKIDREFISNVHSVRENQAICGALVTLSNGLGLKVLAEGTETAAEVSYLRDRGCNLYQGYYFAKPLAPVDFEAGVQKAMLMSAALAMRTDSTAPANFELSRAG